MYRRPALFSSLFACLVSAGAGAPAQTPAPPPAGQSGAVAGAIVIGTVIEIDIEAGTIAVKSDNGDTVTLAYGEKTLFKRLPLGKSTIAEAVPATLAEIGVGDRVTARNRTTAEGKPSPITQMVIMSKADVAKKQETEREAWRTRGIVGVVSALDPQKKEATVSLRTREGLKPITLATGEKASFRRYAADSVKFGDAKPSAFSEIRVGDQLRALGSRSEDGGRYTAEQVVFGTFRTLNVTVVELNQEKNEIQVKRADGKPLTLAVTPDTSLRQLPAGLGFGGGRPGGAPGTGGGGATPAPGGPPAPPNGGPGAGRGGGFDIQAFLERLPKFTVDELKPGAALLVLVTDNPDQTRAVAITVVSGVEAFARFFQQRAGGAGAATGGGPGFGGIDLGIGLP
jgi:hypothetical protein